MTLVDDRCQPVETLLLLGISFQDHGLFQIPACMRQRVLQVYNAY